MRMEYYSVYTQVVQRAWIQKMIKAIFIAPSLDQAIYWAKQWGYRPGEVLFVNTEDDNQWRQKIQGFYQPEMPVYVVGSGDPTSDMWRDLKARGFNVYDGEIPV